MNDIYMDYMFYDLVTEAEDSDDKELKKKKRSLKGKIAKTLLLIGTLGAIIILCKKHGDDESAEKISNLKDTYTDQVNAIDVDNMTSKAEIATAEKQLEQVEKNVTKAKYVAKGKAAKALSKSKGKDSISTHMSNSDFAAGRSFQKQVTGDDEAAKALSDYSYKEFKTAERKAKRFKKGYDIRKGKIINASTDDTLNLYKYQFMIEEVCEKFDEGVLTFESTMDILDAICEKASDKKGLTSSQEKQYNERKKEKKEVIKKIGIAVALGAVIITAITKAKRDVSDIRKADEDAKAIKESMGKLRNLSKQWEICNKAMEDAHNHGDSSAFSDAISKSRELYGDILREMRTMQVNSVKYGIHDSDEAKQLFSISA